MHVNWEAIHIGASFTILLMIDLYTKEIEYIVIWELLVLLSRQTQILASELRDYHGYFRDGIKLFSFHAN